MRTRLEAEGAIAPGGDLDEALAADARRHASDRDDGPPAFVPDPSLLGSAPLSLKTASAYATAEEGRRRRGEDERRR